MKIFTRRNVLLSIFACVVTVATQTSAAAPVLPNPVLVFVGNEYVQSGDKKMIRYYFDVFNKEEYPAEMFAAAPTLPPCGTNTKASRTWVDIYDQNGRRLNGFCALGKTSDLYRIWFALEETDLPPSWVYIEFNDRKTSTKYKSNLAETTL